MEEEKGDWGFKALKQMTKINFHLQKYDAMMKHYKQLLTYIKVNKFKANSYNIYNEVLYTSPHLHLWGWLKNKLIN